MGISKRRPAACLERTFVVFLWKFCFLNSSHSAFECVVLMSAHVLTHAHTYVCIFSPREVSIQMHSYVHHIRVYVFHVFVFMCIFIVCIFELMREK